MHCATLFHKECFQGAGGKQLVKHTAHKREIGIYREREVNCYLDQHQVSSELSRLSITGSMRSYTSCHSGGKLVTF